MSINENKDGKGIGGIRANSLAIPIIAVIVILHLIVIFLFYNISRESKDMSVTMQKTGEYVSDATGLLAGSSLMSETATNFVLVPLTEGGDVNVVPLTAYAAELTKPRRGPDLEARFAKYDVSNEDRGYIAEASVAASAMMDSQLHALALMDSVYHFSAMANLSTIPLPELTATEKNYSKERKEGTARRLLLGTDYALNKQTVSVDVNACCANIQKESRAKTEVMNGIITRYRTILGTVTGLMILMLALAAVLIYQQLLIPLGRITRQIRADQSQVTVRGLREVREMATAYNSLLRRRDALDRILRSAAETDALTNLPNRYAFQQYMVESIDEGYTLGVLLFDVNYLKKINDTKGHAAGDELLRKSADCISTCFGSKDENNCFRLGGDEFAAVMKNPTSELIEREIQRFMMEQQRRQISVSWGYALATELANASVDDLIEAADKRMYQQKKTMHEEAGGEE